MKPKKKRSTTLLVAGGIFLVLYLFFSILFASIVLDRQTVVNRVQRTVVHQTRMMHSPMMRW